MSASTILVERSGVDIPDRLVPRLSTIDALTAHLVAERASEPG